MIDEIWKSIPGYEMYEISSFGRVRRGKPGWRNSSKVGQVRKLNCDGNGYPHVDLWKNNESERFKTCHLVLLAFVGPRPPGLECIHLDETRTNSRLDNLKWGTHKENMERLAAHPNGKLRNQKIAAALRSVYENHPEKRRSQAEGARRSWIQRRLVQR